VAESFGRIYSHNSVAIAFPNIACPGVHETFEEGDEMELNLKTSTVRNLTRSTELQGNPYTADMINIVEKGGLINVLKERLKEKKAGYNRPVFS
jgi:3-isopropylmalate/(R)-2-methylmalate dehydratase small subunit